MKDDSGRRRRPRSTIAVLCLVQLMVLTDTTVFNVALPQAQRELNISSDTREWIVTAYVLAFGSLLLLGGRLSDRWGRRRSLLIGLVGFALASALGGAAKGIGVLVAARALEGAFAALLAPAVLATISVTFTGANARAKAFTLYGFVGGSGAAVGLVLGGALTQWASWRWCLDVNVIIALVALAGVLAFVEGGRATPGRFDLAGALLASAGLLGVVYGLSHAVTTSWASEVTWASLVAGAGLLALFVALERRVASPLVPGRVLASRTRTGSLAALLLTSVALFALFLLLPYYLEETLGYSPLRAGIAFVPFVGALALSATFASARLLSRTGPRPLVPTGMLLGAMGMVLFTRLPESADYWGHVLPGLVVAGLGLGLILAPAIASATAGVADSDVGAGSALVNAVQQIGASFGTALLNTVAVSVTARALRASGSLAGAVRAATLHGYDVAFWWAAGFFALGGLASLVLMQSVAPEEWAAPSPTAPDQIRGQG